MKNRRAVGSDFEDIACDHLRNKGYEIIGRNVTILRKELDIVAIDGDTVVFVEVKGRRSLDFGMPFEAVDDRKRSRILKAATAYLEQANLWGRSVRFDVIGIVVNGEGGIEVDHITDAFGVTK